MKIVKFLYNPYSGHNTIIKHLDAIFEIYQKKGFTLIPYRISKDFSPEMAFDDDIYCDHLLLAGGDGTINSIINAIKKIDIQIPVAILPTGTANDFASCLGMPKNITKACEQILNSKVSKVDLGKINDKYFINVASMGLFTDISQKTQANLKHSMGKLAYYIKGIPEISKLKKLNINIFSKEINYTDSSIVVFIFNGKTAGNLNISYKSKIDDGLLDVVIVKGNIGTHTLISLLEFLKGEHLEKPKGVIHFTTNKLTIDSLENIKTDIDGEPGPNFPLNITCEREALEVLGYVQ